MLIYELAALAELSLVILENCGYVHLSGLPLGGGQIQQIGLIFATAYVIARLIELVKKLPPHRVHRKSRNGQVGNQTETRS